MMRKFFRIQRLTFVSCLSFMLVKFFFFDLALFFIQCSKYVYHLPSRIIPAILAHLMRFTLLPAMAAYPKIARLKRVMAAHRIAMPLCMPHADYHTAILPEK